METVGCMNSIEDKSFLLMDHRIWEAVEGLTTPDPDVRDQALEALINIEGYNKSPLVAYLLATRISDPNIEVRFHIIQCLGRLLDFDTEGLHFSDQALIHFQEFITHLNKDQLIRLLEVANQYLSAEKALVNILKLSSYAGTGLSGIVNDRKLPFSIRQQAVYYCGEMGYLETKIMLQNLIDRAEKNRTKTGRKVSRKKKRDEDSFYYYAVSALEKLQP